MKYVALLLGLSLVGCEEKKKDEPGTQPLATTGAPELPRAASAPAALASARPAKLEKFEMPEIHIKDDAETTVKVAWKVPPGTALNDDAPFRVRWNRSDGLVDAPADAKSTGSAVKDGYSVKVKPMKGAPNPTLAGEIDLVVCDATNHSVCVPVRRQVELGFLAAKDAPTDVKVEMPLPSAR